MREIVALVPGTKIMGKIGVRIPNDLDALGVSHVYASPLFRASPGSLHGYDVADHNAINPEIGIDGPEAEPGAHISRHLVRHGVKADIDRVTALGIDPADLLLNYAADNSADLLVMGGYGRSRLRELVLGGFTRHILRHMTLPVLMSH